MKKILSIIGLFLITSNFLFAGGGTDSGPPSPPDRSSAPAADISQRLPPPMLPLSPVPPTPPPLPPAPAKPTENTIIREQQTGTLTLDMAIENSGKRIEEAVPGAKLAVLNFTSSSEKFSDYVVEELNGVLAEGKKVTIP